MSREHIVTQKEQLSGESLYPFLPACPGGHGTLGRGRPSRRGALLTQATEVTGLTAGLRPGLGRWRKPLAVHDPGKIQSDLALSLTLGGDCLADLSLLRAEPGVYGRVASEATVSRC